MLQRAYGNPAKPKQERLCATIRKGFSSLEGGVSVVLHAGRHVTHCAMVALRQEFKTQGVRISTAEPFTPLTGPQMSPMAATTGGQGQSRRPHPGEMWHV